jgi:hypothetical protein
MSDRFYMQMLVATGNCPGAKLTQIRRTKKVAWTDEKKAQVIKMYQDANPTPETSIEIVQEIAEEVNETPNGVRMVLTKAEVYIKKGAASGTAKKASSGATGTKVSKEAAHTSLKEAIKDAGQEVNDELIEKLTGKAAIYFADILKAVNK